MGQKPFEGTGTANWRKHGVGALNIDGCRIETDGEVNPSIGRRQGAVNHLSDHPAAETDAKGRMVSRQSPEAYRAERPGEALGRWPANLVHDGSSEVEAAFPDAPGMLAAVRPDSGTGQKTTNVYGKYNANSNHTPRGDKGSAARFFYAAKASRKEKQGTLHPTVKPVALMRWLCRLVTPPGGTVLDCFAGSGTTGVAAVAEGLNAVLIEQDPTYCQDICSRLEIHIRAASGL